MVFRTIPVLMIAAAIVPSVALGEARGPCSRVVEADGNAQPFDDQTYESTIQYFEGGNLVKTFALNVITQGMHKMLITFEAPGEVRGMRILSADPDTMYVYHPEYRRVRRVAAHVRNQGFMGTNVSYDDMTEHRLSDRWQCSPSETTDDAWILNLTPRAETKSSYSKLRGTIGRKRVQVERIEYFQGTRHVKSQIREGWRTMEGLEMASRIRFVSHDREAEARVELTQWRVNSGVEDSAFTRRALLRSE